MGAGPWKLYASALFHLGRGDIRLGVGVFKMSLHRPEASAAIMRLSLRSTFASIPGEISARGGYVVGGRALDPPGGLWGPGVSAQQIEFGFTTVIYTASNSALNNIKYALIRNSTGPGAGLVFCYCTLSTAPFTISPDNLFFLLPDVLGAVFTLA
jgi:hypothetical protein